LGEGGKDRAEDSIMPFKIFKRKTQSFPVPAASPASTREAFFGLLIEFLFFLTDKLRDKNDRFFPSTIPNPSGSRREMLSRGIDVCEVCRGGSFEREEPGKWRWAIVNGVPTKITLP
jgi:hypothetical protein